MGDRNAVARKRARIVLSSFCVAAIALMVSFAIPVFTKTIENALQSKQIGRGKNLLTGLALFAADKGGGKYPQGNYDPKTEDLLPPNDKVSAEECFQNLIDSKLLDLENLFWHPGHARQCSEEKPNEDGKLEPGENSWDYIAGMNNSVGNLPLIFTASDYGLGKTWTKAGGHPWEKYLVVGMADGSSTKKESLDSNGRCLIPRASSPRADNCVPLPGKDGWPELARIAPATPVK